MKNNEVLGIDVGASGIKGAIVDIRTGRLVSDRLRLATPQPATNQAVAETFGQLVREFAYSGPIGCGFPAVIKKGMALTASNIDKEWIGKSVEAILSDASGSPVKVLNDADAAGIAEMNFGLGAGSKGLVLLITIGSGLGSALFLDGKLLPNTELGHLYLHGDIAERYASDRTRKDHDLSWSEWGQRFNEYLQHLYLLLSPDQIILGGGTSKKFDRYQEQFDLPIPVQPAHLLNNAGIVGAAHYAARELGV